MRYAVFVETNIQKCLPYFGQEVVAQWLQSASAVNTVWGARHSVSLFSPESSAGQLGTLDSVLTVGWDRPEDALTWSVQRECKIHVPVPEAWTAPFVIQISCRGFYHNAPGQKIRATLLSGSVIERIIDRDEQRVDISIGEKDISNGSIKIAIAIADPISPAEVSTESTDYRQLGLAVHWIKILQDMRCESSSINTVWGAHKSASLFSPESSAGQLGTLDSVLTAGWDRPEDDLTWSVQSECEVDVPVPEQWTAPFVIQFSCRGFYRNGPGQTIQATLLSGSVIERVIDRHEQRVDIPVGEEDISNGLVKITILISDPTSPAEVAPESTDNRRLGLAVHWIKILQDSRYANPDKDPGQELDVDADTSEIEGTPILPRLQIYDGPELFNLLDDGWHTFEESGTWSCRNSATLKFRLAERERIFVTMSVEVFNPRRKDVTLEFITPSGSQSWFQFTGRVRTRPVEISIAPEDVDEHGFCSLKIVSNSLSSPADVGESKDTRLIGFRITSLRISRSSSSRKKFTIRSIFSNRFGRGGTTG